MTWFALNFHHKVSAFYINITLEVIMDQNIKGAGNIMNCHTSFLNVEKLK